MIFVAVFFLNAAANFALGIVLSALLGPTEFGRFAMVTLGATTLAMALFDWLRLSCVRFSASLEGRQATAASLEASYLAMIAATAIVVAALLALGLDRGLGASLVALAALMGVVYARSDYTGAQLRA
jgi:hypothetical protein